MEYSALPINQRINVKANSLIHYGSFRFKYLSTHDPRIAAPLDRMLLRAPGADNNRNYDGPGDNYYQQ